MCLRQITLRYTLGAQLREDAAAAAAFPPAPSPSYPIHMQNATTLIGNLVYRVIVAQFRNGLLTDDRVTVRD